MNESAPVASGTSLPPVPRRRRRWVSILLAVALLICGGVIGAGVTLLTVVSRAQHAIRHPEEFPARASARLRRMLDLTPEQTRGVEDVLRKRQARLQAIRREVQPRVETEIDAIGREVGAILNEAQAAKWNRWLSEKRSTWMPPSPTGTSPASAPG